MILSPLGTCRCRWPTHQISIIGELKYPVFLVNGMQVGRSDGIRRWSKRRSLNNAGANSGDCRHYSGILGAVGMILKKVDYPVVDTVRYCELCQQEHSVAH